MLSWERQFSFTVPLFTLMHNWEPVTIILVRRAITNLSPSRYVTFYFRPKYAFSFVLAFLKSSPVSGKVSKISDNSSYLVDIQQKS